MAAAVLVILPIAGASNRGKINRQGRYPVQVHLVTLIVIRQRLCRRAGPRADDPDGLILLGFNNGGAGRMAPFAHARRVAALSQCGELPGVRAPAAAAVCWRTKASGRRQVPRAPCGRVAPVLCRMRLGFPAVDACGHAPPGARRAGRALETVEIVIAAPGRRRREGADAGLAAHRYRVRSRLAPKIGHRERRTANRRSPDAV